MPVNRSWINALLAQGDAGVAAYNAVSNVADATDALERRMGAHTSARGQAATAPSAPEAWTITSGRGRYLHSITPPAGAPVQYELQSSPTPDFNPQAQITNTASTATFTNGPGGPNMPALPLAFAYGAKLAANALDLVLDCANYNAYIFRVDGRAGQVAGQILKEVSGGAWASIGAATAPPNAGALSGWHQALITLDEGGGAAIRVDGVLRWQAQDDSVLANYQGNTWLLYDGASGPSLLPDIMRDYTLGLGQTSLDVCDAGGFKWWRARWRYLGSAWSDWLIYAGAGTVPEIPAVGKVPAASGGAGPLAAGVP